MSLHCDPVLYHQRHVYVALRTNNPCLPSSSPAAARRPSFHKMSSSSAVGVDVLRFEGCRDFRLRLILSTLSRRRLRIDSIRSKDEEPGLRDFEASFLRLVDALTNGSRIEINDTGTSMRYSPGLVIGGSLEHACSLSRPVGWYIEGILPLLPFAKRGTTLTLTGVTNDDSDLSVDTLRLVTLPLLGLFGFGEGLSLTLKRRGARPLGGGSVVLTCLPVRELTPINLTEQGLIRKVRGLAYTCKVSPQNANRAIEAAR
jgi:RNA 3'-terminal phosphate cyclase-like protein